MKKGRTRVDALLVARGLAQTRAEAQALVLAGEVYQGERRVEKSGVLVADEVPLTVRAKRRFVSRGGDKLDAALEVFAAAGLVVAGARCLDVGASTGGFTDCLLQRGAASVVAVDVGFGQLASKLRADPRVDVRERTNARDLAPRDFAEPIDLVVVDASFISLAKLAPPIARLVGEGAALVALVKPQFEAGREAASKGRGVIRDAAVREAAIASARVAVEAAGFSVVSSVDSALAGPKGNVEHFLFARRTNLASREK